MKVSKVGFLIALFGAPALFGALVWAFALLGDYAMRFSQVGAIGLLAMLPAWFITFSWMAWWRANRGETGTRDFVLASLRANTASLVIFPIFVGLAVLTGGYDAMIASVSTAPDAPPPPTPAGMAVFFGLGVTLLGIFLMPVLAWVFAKIFGRLAV